MGRKINAMHGMEMKAKEMNNMERKGMTSE